MGLFQLRRRRKRPARRPKHSGHPESKGPRTKFKSQVSPTVSEGPLKWKVVRVRQEHPTRKSGVSFRTSFRWFVSSDLRTTNSVPYISSSGKLSIYNVYRWDSLPAQVFASVVSTSYTRMMNLLHKRHSKNFAYVKSLRNACIKVALCYVITHNDYVIDRFLGMTRRKARTPKKVVNNYAHRCVCNLDGDKRFVYSQAYTQANWLKFLVKRPSDKSRGCSGRGLGSHLKNLGGIWGLDLEANLFMPVSFKESIRFLETYKPVERPLRPVRTGGRTFIRSDSLTRVSERREASTDWFFAIG